MRFTSSMWLLAALFASAPVSAQTQKSSSEGQKCLECHGSTTPGIVSQWNSSAHAKAGVACYSCHRANANDPATFDHYGQKIAVIVTPNYCGSCHAKELAQFEKSHHAAAAQFIGSLDNMLGEVVEGGPAAINGCRQCHGSEVKYSGDGKFDPDTWPNSGTATHESRWESTGT
jgi:hydroxylamine dehydrogenase